MFHYCDRLWVLEQNQIEHTHKSLPKQSRPGLSTETKLHINSLVLNGINKPSSIRFSILLNSDQATVIPTINQIRHHLYKSSKVKTAFPTMQPVTQTLVP
jgi:hypothetical protein